MKKKFKNAEKKIQFYENKIFTIKTFLNFTYKNKLGFLSKNFNHKKLYNLNLH